MKSDEYIDLLPKNIAESGDFTNNQKKLLGYLLFCNGTDFAEENGYFFLTNEKISKETQIGAKYLLQYIVKFKTLGFVKRNSGKRNKASEYIVDLEKIQQYESKKAVSKNKVSILKKETEMETETKNEQLRLLLNRVSILERKLKEKETETESLTMKINELENKVSILERVSIEKETVKKETTDTESEIETESEKEASNIAEYVEKENATETETTIVETRSGEDATDKEIAEFFAEWGEVEATANSAYDFFDDYSAVTRAEAGEQTEIADTIAKVEYTTEIAEDIATGNSAATEIAIANDYSRQAYSIAEQIAGEAADNESEITNNNSNTEKMKDTTQQMRETATLEQVLEQQALEYAAMIRQPQQQFNSAGEKYDLKADTDKVFKAAKALTIENKAAAFAEVERLDAAYKQRPLTPKQRQWWEKSVAAFYAAVAKIDGVPLQNNVWFVEGTPNVSANDVNDWLGLVAFYPDSETRRRVFISLLKAQSFTAKVLEYANEKSGFDPITVEDVAAAKRG